MNQEEYSAQEICSYFLAMANSWQLVWRGDYLEMPKPLDPNRMDWDAVFRSPEIGGT